MIAYKKHGAISVVSAMLTSMRHNSFVLILRPTESDPVVKANMEQWQLVWDNQNSQRKSCMCAICTLKVPHERNWDW